MATHIMYTSSIRKHLTQQTKRCIAFALGSRNHSQVLMSKRKHIMGKCAFPFQHVCNGFNLKRFQKEKMLLAPRKKRNVVSLLCSLFLSSTKQIWVSNITRSHRQLWTRFS